MTKLGASTSSGGENNWARGIYFPGIGPDISD